MEFKLNISLILPEGVDTVPQQGVAAVHKLNSFFQLRGISINLTTDSETENIQGGFTVKLEYHNPDTLVYDILLEADTRCGYKISDIIFVGNSSIVIDGEKVVSLDHVSYYLQNGLLASYREKLQCIDPYDEESEEVMALRKEMSQKELLFFNYDLFCRSVANGSNPIKDRDITDKILEVYQSVFNARKDAASSMDHILEMMSDVVVQAQDGSNTEELLMVLKLYSEFLIIAEKFEQGCEILERYHTIYNGSSCAKSFQMEQQRVVCLYFLASVLFSLKEFDKSIEVFEHTVDSATNLLGEYHPDIMFFLHVYASVYEVQAMYSHSARIQDLLTGKIEHVYGRNSYQYAISVNNTAYCCYKDGNYSKAVELYMESIGILESLNEERWALFCTIYDNISNCLWEEEQFEEAMEYALKSYSLREQIFGEGSIELAESYKLLGKCHYALDEMESALEMYRKALPVFLRHYGSMDRTVLVIYSDMASCYLNESNYKEAEKCLFKTLEIQTQIYGESHIETATTYHKLGFLHFNTGNTDQALQLYKKALEIRRENLRQDHPDISNILTNMARLYSQQQEWDMALEHFRESFDIVKRNFGALHKRTRELGIETIDACFGAEKFNLAIELLEDFLQSCYRVSEKSEEHLADVAWFHHALGLAYENVEELNKALENYIKAFTVRKNIYGEEHPETVSSYEAYIMVQSILFPYRGKLQ